MTKLTSSNIDFKLLKDCSILDADELDLRDQLGPDISIAVDNYLSKLKQLSSSRIVIIALFFTCQKCVK
jgi:hypothetical protein